MNNGKMKNNTLYYVIPKPATVSNDLLLEKDEIDNVTNYEQFKKIYMFGEKSSCFKSTGELQNYEKLLQQHLQNNTLFTDETFSPESIALPKLDKKGDIVWKRPSQIIENPKFFVDGVSRFDINQGKLGDCWFLASVINLTANSRLFAFVVPENQKFDQHYAGIFHFRFWQYGRWIDVVIDDRLPTIDNKLIFMHSTEPHEFWPALLEKAYAKFYGSYKNIEGGQISEGMEDLCGGLSESYDAKRPELFEIMYTSYKRSSFMGCFIVSTEAERTDGLITSHAYSVTGMEKNPVPNSELRLIRLRNPWGKNFEWNGNWSDKSECWSTLSKEITEKLLTRKDDGEFWMEFGEFQQCFTTIDIVHLNPSSFVFEKDTQWKVFMFEGCWVPNVTAGGSLKYIKTFPNNPQYHITVRGNNSDSFYQVVIGLMQKTRRDVREEDLPLELNIFRVQSNAGNILDKSFFEAEKPLVSRLVSGLRQLTIRVALPVGKYCVIPSTWRPNVYSCYLLRIYSEANANIVDNDNDVGYSTDAILNQTHNEEELRQVAQNNNEIGWYGVKKALNKHFGNKRIFCFIKPKISFSKNTCKHIVALWDTNFSGQLDSEEFQRLINDVAALNAIFRRFDKDRSGKLDGFELRNLLSECGYKVNRQILTIIMLRYGYNGSMSFENFVVCAFKLKTMIDEFHRRQTIETNVDQINVNRRDWLQTTLYS